jgi:hypothetical protein
VSGMASGSEAVLEWHKQDNKRMLHAVYRVGDLDRAIKYVAVMLTVFHTSGRVV